MGINYTYMSLCYVNQIYIFKVYMTHIPENSVMFILIVQYF